MIPIETSKAPAPLGPYSQGVVAPKGAQLLFVSGQLPIDPLSGELVNGKIEPLTEQVIKNTQQILIEGGSDLEKVLRVEIFLIDLKGDYHRLNEVYGKYFNTPPLSCEAGCSGRRATDGI